MWRSRLLGLMTFVGVVLAASGCATKGYVRDSIESVRGDMGALEQRLDGRADQNADLAGRAMSRVELLAAGSDSLRALALGWTNVREVARFRAHFAFDSAELSEESEATLAQAAASLARNPNYVATIYGYADPTGSDAYNYDLAERRAQSAERYLVGEAPGDLIRCRSISFGEHPPGSESTSTLGNSEQRQVVIVLLERVPAATQEQLSGF